MHAVYAELVEKARESHARHRSPSSVSSCDVGRARLYCYAFRGHTIGAFHATRLAIEQLADSGPLSAAYRLRATEALQDLANLAMEPVPNDFRAVIATLYRYHQGIARALDSVERDQQISQNPLVSTLAHRLHESVEQITRQCGIHLTQDTHAPEQASFIVPNLGITIVPLVYGDHHSWNLAFLAGSTRNVPTHRHHHGVEIHLGYDPTHGMTVLGGARAPVDEGYAMPIPPETDHGWINTSDELHHVPFIFGSAIHGGWGVFLDVEAQPLPVEQITRPTERDSIAFQQMVYLEREIRQAAGVRSSWRKVLIPYTVTNRRGSGGLELAVARISSAGYSYPTDSYRIVSVARGEGVVQMEGLERTIRAHDHFGVPAGMQARLQQTGDAPLIALDSVLRTH